MPPPFLTKALCFILVDKGKIMNRRGSRGMRIPVRKANDRNSKPQSVEATPQTVEDEVDIKLVGCEDDIAELRETVLRLKADMQNYRNRQQRWAQDEVQRQKDQLLVEFIRILDDMEKAVAHLESNSVTHQAVKIAYDNMLKLLAQQGVERINAQGATFDPTWHDAVAMVPGLHTQTEPLKVTEVVSHGYRIGERLLRPSQVVVSQRRS